MDLTILRLRHDLGRNITQCFTSGIGQFNRARLLFIRKDFPGYHSVSYFLQPIHIKPGHLRIQSFARIAGTYAEMAHLPTFRRKTLLENTGIISRHGNNFPIATINNV